RELVENVRSSCCCHPVAQIPDIHPHRPAPTNAKCQHRKIRKKQAECGIPASSLPVHAMGCDPARTSVEKGEGPPGEPGGPWYVVEKGLTPGRRLQPAGPSCRRRRRTE